MADEQKHDEEPVIRDKRKIDPETGDVREPATDGAADNAAPPVDGPNADGNAGDANSADAGTPLTPEDQLLLDQASADLVAEMRSDMLRAQAELVNFRTRVERDRQANRDAVIAEVIRALLPTLDDLDRAEAHGDLVEGAPLTLVAQKLRGSFDKFGLARVGEKGDAFDPAFHEAVVQIPTLEATSNTIADVIQPGYTLGERLVRPAKVAVSVPAE